MYELLITYLLIINILLPNNKKLTIYKDLINVKFIFIYCVFE